MFSPNDHSFVVCAYGESPYLEDCVKTLVTQTVNTKIVISTATPNQHIYTIAKKYGLEVIANSEQLGIVHDFNFAYSTVPDSKLVTLAHQDDVYNERYVSCMLEMINDSRDPLIYFSDYSELRDGEFVEKNALLRIKRIMLAPLRFRRLRKSTIAKKASQAFGDSICDPAVTYVRDKMPNPLFDVRFKCDEDWALWATLASYSGEFVYDKRILMSHRIHRGSATSALILDNTRTREDLDVLEMFWPRPVAKAINKIYRKSENSNWS